MYAHISAAAREYVWLTRTGNAPHPHPLSGGSYCLTASLYFLCSVPQSLFELELAGCNEVTEAGLWSCLTPRIVSLSLADCINIADEAVGAVAQLLPSLYEFSLQVSDGSAPPPHGTLN